MKVPTIHSVLKKAMCKEKLNPIENFILHHASALGDDNRTNRQLRKNLQKVVDFVEKDLREMMY